MAQIRPFYALRPQKGFEARIAALPYDVLSLEEARCEVEREPLSFLAIDRPETIAGQGENIYEKAGRLLQERIEEGYFAEDELPGFYIYELTAGGRSQTGIGALTSVDDYLSGTICRHENTRADKEADRVRHVQACRAQTGPIFLAYREREEIGAIVQDHKEKAEPVYDFTAADGVRHRLWCVQDVEEIEALYDAFLEVPRFYIADGHHRCSAAVSCALQKRKENPGYTGEEPWNFILSVLFPDEELKILDYNRVVKDLNGLSAEALLERMEESFLVEASGRQAVIPDRKGCFGMYVQGCWYRLLAKEKNADPVEGLDVSVLQNQLLAPILGIMEPRTDGRISFVGGSRGLAELEQLADQYGGVAFSMYPTAMAELFAVADKGRLMPPKSTWFEPKLRSGLLLHRFD